MAKVSEVPDSQLRGAEERSRRKRGRTADSSYAFACAFADALRDILHDERRRALWY